MNAFAWIFVFSAIGVSETAYLIQTRFASKKPVCLIGGNCNTVLSSKYNRLFLIHNDILGLTFYSLTCLMAVFSVLGIGDQKLILHIIEGLISAATVMSMVLVIIQWRIIREWCFWCLTSAMVTWLMAIVLILHTNL